MNVECSERQRHARALLDAVHPAHCANVPEPLLQRALQSPVGRRHLARTVLRQAPDVFAPDHERWQAWQDDEPWLQWPQARLYAFTRELGAISLGPALRMLVERNAVLFVRDALGLATWRRAQSAQPWPGSAPEAVRQMGSAVLQRCGRDGQALSDAVHGRGMIEFLGHAERRDERLAARLALAYAQAPLRPCRGDCWLPNAAIPALLVEQQALDEEASVALVAAEGRTE
ncbi:hypothetical protein [Dyella flagellata]|uniref:Uncharacterized protein n=1 Tax=Dyella flagellata TaxID=1867833 RepID=A0ABQ5X993_9GAMM|nr:hypothetical protein [Dyella flagellata]GLQ87837.1 hypothetical protein GCM10007898_14050 [Dyella flagellata]